MGDKSDSLFKELEKIYCPPLDAALFTAIVSDYDFADPTQVQQLRDTLDILQQSALEQEDFPFDPSGTSGLGTTNNDVDGVVSDRSTSRNDIQSQETDITSYSSEFSSISLRDKDVSNGRSVSSGSAGYIVGADGNVTLAGASIEDKVAYLMEMFPSVDQFTVKHTLKKSDGDVDRSMDVLLNLAFFDEQPADEDGGKVSVPKGIDGFEDSTIGARGKGRKRKMKNKKNRPPSLEEESAFYAGQDDTRTTNKWDAGQKDVEFIHSRTSPILKKETVTSAYHASGASLPATIRSLATAHAPKKEQITHDDPITETQIAELIQEFPSITPATFSGLLHITRNSTSAANELAAALVTRPLAPSVSQLIQFTATPLKLEDDDDNDKATRNRRAAAEPRITRDFDRAQGSAGMHFVAGGEALSKASVAYRRGRSDRLMGGAAAYYSAVGRDHLERAKRNAAAASDALVDAQSTSTMLDLHGVSVQDAVRIAGERVPEWWDSLGESKYMRGRTGPLTYRIVTGVGRHSHDGTSRLGPAVFKRLVRDGWRVEVGEGVFTVTGVARR